MYLVVVVASVLSEAAVMAGHNFKTGYWDADIVKDTATRAEVEAFYADLKNVEVVTNLLSIFFFIPSKPLILDLM